MSSIVVLFQTFANETGVGTTAWGDVANAATDDSQNATATLGGSAISNYLKCTNRTGAAIPTGSTINGFEIKYEAGSGVTATGKDHTLKMVKGGSIVGNNLANTGVNWQNPSTIQTRGSSSELAGTTWTAEEVNASNFGVALACQRVGGTSPNIAGLVDYVQVEIFYTEGSPPASGGNGQMWVSD